MLEYVQCICWNMCSTIIICVYNYEAGCQLLEYVRYNNNMCIIYTVYNYEAGCQLLLY